jgi:cell division protein FtsW
VAKRVGVDKGLFIVTVALTLIGLLMVFSASAVMAKERFGSPYSFLLKQLMYAAVGILAMLGCMRFDYKRYKQPAVVYTLFGVVTLLLIAVFFLDRSHNTHRWVRLGSFSLQPSEIAKPAIILYLAWFLESRLKTLDDWRHTLLPAILPVFVCVVLIVLEPDLGTAIACAMIAGAILFVAGLRLRYYAYALVASVLPLYFLLWRVPWRRDRLLAFLDPWSDPQGRGFHIIQSLIAVGTGGLSGQGLMEGKQKLFYLPEPQTDFIFAVVSEEFGLIGSTILVIFFAWFLFRGTRTALLCKDTFGRFLAVGITMMVVFQALMNISVVVGMLPTKGIPLPFISYGGSSLIVMLASVGVLLNITQHTE